MLSTISVATPEVDSRLTHPPNVSFEDIARYWGEILNTVLPINWFLLFIATMSASTGRSE